MVLIRDADGQETFTLIRNKTESNKRGRETNGGQRQRDDESPWSCGHRLCLQAGIMY